MFEKILCVILVIFMTVGVVACTEDSENKKETKKYPIIRNRSLVYQAFGLRMR